MVDGKPLPQSLAIGRYVAKEVGLVPEDNLQAAYCDALADTITEMMGAMRQIMWVGSGVVCGRCCVWMV